MHPDPECGDLILVLLQSTLKGLADRMFEDKYIKQSHEVASLASQLGEYLDEQQRINDSLQEIANVGRIQ